MVGDLDLVYSVELADPADNFCIALATNALLLVVVVVLLLVPTLVLLT